MSDVSIIEALDDAELLGSVVKDASTFVAWRALLKSMFGLPLDVAEAELFFACTGREELPAAAFAVSWLVCGRRSGKSAIMAAVAVFMACLRDWAPYLAAGERAVVLIVAADREQAKIVRRYVSGILSASPLLAARIEGETAESVSLAGDVVIEVATCSFRSVRGRSVCCALLDEVAFWRSESTANPDVEVWRAIRASMATFGSAGLAMIASSPYARRGLLWDAYRRNFGTANPVNLVWQAATRVMNPTVPEAFIAEEYATDPAAAAAEYGAEFRSDLEAFVSREVVDAAVISGRRELPRIGSALYAAFADPAGGSGTDSMTLCIAHAEGETVVIDAIREVRPPFSPDAAVAEFAALLTSYGIHRVVGDRYAGAWPTERFMIHGIAYEASAKPKSDLYRDALPLLNAGRVELLDHPRLVAQLLGLERRTARSGKDSIDHGPNGHDDVANAVAGAIGAVSYRKLTLMDVLYANEEEEDERQNTRSARVWDPANMTSQEMYTFNYLKD